MVRLIEPPHKCPKCGEELLYGAEFCSKCGYKLSKPGMEWIDIMGTVVGHPEAGTISLANATATFASGLYTEYLYGIDTLKKIGVPAEYLKPIEANITKLKDDKEKAERERDIALKLPTEKSDESAKLDNIQNNLNGIKTDINGIKKDVDKGFYDASTQFMELRKRLDEKPTKDDLEKVAGILIIKQDVLLQRMDELKDISKQIEEKVGPEQTGRFKSILDKLSSIKDKVELAIWIEQLIDWMIANDTWKIIWPYLAKIIFG